MASDAFIVGEDWISEHYFTTESTKQSFQARLVALRKTWDERAKDGEPTPLTKLSAARREVVAALAREDDDTAVHLGEVVDPLIAALGYADARWHRTTSGPVTFVAASETPDSPAAVVVRARRVGDVADLLDKNAVTLVAPFEPEDADPVTSVARCLSYVLGGDEAPAFAVVVAGTWALLAERERWAEGRYLAVDLQLVLDRNEQKKGGEFDRAVAVLCSETVLPDVDGTTWWAETLEDSVKHTVGVSKDLREGVRESIEIIANEVVRRRAAQGLEPLPGSEANTLARQSLRYLYRILFLLFAEASPEMKVLPVGAPEYSLGYGLDRLRELVLVELGEESRHRTHLASSLATLFRLVDAGHDAPARGTGDHTLPEGLVFNPLSADLFTSTATSLIDEVGLGDGGLQRVLQLLLLTRENQVKKGRDRGFISYADLGVNQLGAVYEGLMSYTGFFAEEDLYEVAPGGDGSKGSWVVPVARSQDIAAKDFIRVTDPITGESKPRRYTGGEFVYRLSGRERQTSASYYSPEVLTRFVVSQALEELLDQDDERTTAEQILGLSVCEPALGSGAFAIEAVRQLAEQYLDRREQEVGERIDPDERPRELQKVKAAIALHQVYGVDLNATAVELAEISLWLDTMVDGLAAPWFGLRLRRGNSLIGARRAVYSQKQVTDKAWLNDVPTSVPLTSLVSDMREGRIGSETSGKIHHFLLPADGWGAAVDAKEAKELVPEAHAALRAWRNGIRRKPSTTQLKRLTALSHRVETLWQFTLRRLEIAELQASRDIPLWNDPREPSVGGDPVARAQIEEFLGDPDGPYQRLRRVMDAWCALWFWPLTDELTRGVQPPSLGEWIGGLEAVLGVHRETNARAAAAGQQDVGLPTTWGDLADAEEINLGFASAMTTADATGTFPWLTVAGAIAESNGFFHWELDFAGVFSHGGFDLQVGNPPWVRPTFDSSTTLAEHDVWWALTDSARQHEINERRACLVSQPHIRDAVVDETTNASATKAALNAPTRFPLLQGMQADLYRCFMEASWWASSQHGVSALIHPDSHFTDNRAGYLRAETYQRLRRHWHFKNELRLFEIGHSRPYAIHVYGSARTPRFLNATSLYHPSTVSRSLDHNGTGPQPSAKDASGAWNTSPHRDRIQLVDQEVLHQWAELFGLPRSQSSTTPMVYLLSVQSAAALSAITAAPRVGDIPLEFHGGWHETGGRRDGWFDHGWGDSGSWQEAILQGTHLGLGRPLNKYPRHSGQSSQGWAEVDLEAASSTMTPVTDYKVDRDLAQYQSAFGYWSDHSGLVCADYRIAWRSMADNDQRRTLIPAIVPPGTTHVHSVMCAGGPSVSLSQLGSIFGQMLAITSDFAVRVAPKSGIGSAAVSRLPFAPGGLADLMIRHRALRLNCLTSSFEELWEACYDATFDTDSWAPSAVAPLETLGSSKPNWSIDTPLRCDIARRQALLEIDVLTSIAIGLSIDTLVALVHSQFGVLVEAERNEHFDAYGRLVPNEVLKVWRQKGDAVSQEERTATNASGNTYEYVLPFVTLDREADMRQAYAHFERILQERS